MYSIKVEPADDAEAHAAGPPTYQSSCRHALTPPSPGNNSSCSSTPSIDATPIDRFASLECLRCRNQRCLYFVNPHLAAAIASLLDIPSHPLRGYRIQIQDIGRVDADKTDERAVLTPDSGRSKKRWQLFMRTIFDNVASHSTRSQDQQTIFGLPRPWRSPVLTRETFFQVFPQLPGVLGERLFAAFDSDRSGTIDFNEFSRGLAVLASSSVTVKLRFIFSMYDLNGDGSLSKDEVAMMLTNIPACVSFLSGGKTTPDVKAKLTIARPSNDELPASRSRKRSQTTHAGVPEMSSLLSSDSSAQSNSSVRRILSQPASRTDRDDSRYVRLSSVELVVDALVSKAFESISRPTYAGGRTSKDHINFSEFCEAVALCPELRLALEIFCQETIRPQDFLPLPPELVGPPGPVLPDPVNPPSPGALLGSPDGSNSKVPSVQSTRPQSVIFAVGADFDEPLPSPGRLSPKGPRGSLAAAGARHLAPTDVGQDGDIRSWKQETRQVHLPLADATSSDFMMRCSECGGEFLFTVTKKRPELSPDHSGMCSSRRDGSSEDFCGWLEKDGRLTGMSVRRFFVIKGRFLYAYLSPLETMPRTVVLLTGCQVEPILESNTVKTPSRARSKARTPALSTVTADGSISMARSERSHSRGISLSRWTLRGDADKRLFPEETESFAFLPRKNPSPGHALPLRGEALPPRFAAAERRGFRIKAVNKRVRSFYARTREERDEWVTRLTNAALLSNGGFHDVYVLQEALGSGQYATVYRAVQRNTQEEVAVKVLKRPSVGRALLEKKRRHLSRYQTAAKREEDMMPELQRREIAVLRLLDHPNIIRLIDVFQSQDFIYIVMEWGPSGDLQRLLNLVSHINKGLAIHGANSTISSLWIPEWIIRGTIEGILRGLTFLHSSKRNVIHRDLKPDNVLMKIGTAQLKNSMACCIPGLPPLFDIDGTRSSGSDKGSDGFSPSREERSRGHEAPYAPAPGHTRSRLAPCSSSSLDTVDLYLEDHDPSDSPVRLGDVTSRNPEGVRADVSLAVTTADFAPATPSWDGWRSRDDSRVYGSDAASWRCALETLNLWLFLHCDEWSRMIREKGAACSEQGVRTEQGEEITMPHFLRNRNALEQLEAYLKRLATPDTIVAANSLFASPLVKDTVVPKITDFGLSTIIAPHEPVQYTQSTISRTTHCCGFNRPTRSFELNMLAYAKEAMGTAAYAAPEVVQGLKYMTSADIWSLGVMAYQLLSCGSFPHFSMDDTSGRTLVKLIFEPQDQWARVSEAAKDFVTKILEPDPTARLTAQEALKHIWLHNEKLFAPN